jgi:hypothetical protein
MPAARSVKDVPERFVKDVMELDTFEGRVRDAMSVGFSPRARQNIRILPVT